MARRLRIQYPGARYHVINRGNLQHDIFATSGAKHAFLVTLDEASVQFGWRASAFVIMRNHYHLALQTPEPNLVEGMHWLQSTFAIRLTRFHLRDAENSAKGAEWKVAIVGKLRQSIAAPYRWIAETLKMGHPGSLGGQGAPTGSGC